VSSARQTRARVDEPRQARAGLRVDGEREVDDLDVVVRADIAVPGPVGWRESRRCRGCPGCSAPRSSAAGRRSFGAPAQPGGQHRDAVLALLARPAWLQPCVTGLAANLRMPPAGFAPACKSATFPRGGTPMGTPPPCLAVLFVKQGGQVDSVGPAITCVYVSALIALEAWPTKAEISAQVRPCACRTLTRRWRRSCGLNVGVRVATQARVIARRNAASFDGPNSFASGSRSSRGGRLVPIASASGGGSSTHSALPVFEADDGGPPLSPPRTQPATIRPEAPVTPPGDERVPARIAWARPLLVRSAQMASILLP
jgi:hypothetical protein